MRRSAIRCGLAAAAAAVTLAVGGCGVSDVSAPDILTAPTGAPSMAVSGGTPAAGLDPVRAVDLAVGSLDGPAEVSVGGGPDGVRVTVREITLEPGSSTGEHCHHGQLIAVIRQGELTDYSDSHPGGSRIYRAGESFIEHAGHHHDSRNEGDKPMVAAVTYLIREGERLTEMDMGWCQI